MKSMWRLCTLGSVVAVLPIAAAFAAPCPMADVTVATDNDCDGIDDDLEQQLANLYAPVIVIESDESNYPVNVEWFLERAHMQYHEDCFSDIDDDVGPNPLMTQSNLIGPPWSEGSHCGEDDTGYSHPPHRTITTIAADPDGQVSAGAATTGYSDQQTFVLPDLANSYRVGSLNPLDWKTYFHAYPSKDGGIILQYWHLFAYNHLAVAGFGDHGGDWDATIHVQLGPDLRVGRVWFSRHANDHPGDPIGPEQITWIDGTHPLMTIDGGGHAAYAFAQDFCDHRSPAGGTAAWPSDATDPLSPEKLVAIDCGGIPIVGPPFFGDHPGGTVWQTRDGGMVIASGGLTNPIVSPSFHGGMVNLGEYNPCTPTTCNGSRQASQLLAGEFHSLNDQIFIRFEGKWGNLPSGPSPIEPPRGPVFQGMQDTGSEVTYNSWYNQGADTPASPATNPWRQPSTTVAGVSGPQFVSGGRTFISGTTQLTFSVSQNAVAAAYGGPHSFYRVYVVGSTPPAFVPYLGAFAISPPDADYQIDFYSLDSLNNRESMQSIQVTLDTTPPTVSVPSSATVRVCDAAQEGSIVPVAAASDASSGVQSIDGFVIASEGKPVDPPVHVEQGHVFVDVGNYTIQWQARDNVGNIGIASEIVDVSPAVFGIHGVTLRHGAKVKTETSNRAPIGSGGAVELEPNAQSGEIRTLGWAFLHEGAHVFGPVFSSGPIVRQNFVVTEGLFPYSTVSLVQPPIPSFVVPPPDHDVWLFPHTTRTISAGSFGRLAVEPHAVLKLTPGTYDFTNVMIEPDATMQLLANGEYAVVATSGFAFRGRLVYPADFQGRLQIAYLGRWTAFIDGQLDRVDLLAPAAAVVLESSFSGTILADEIEVGPRVLVVCDLLR